MNESLSAAQRTDRGATPESGSVTGVCTRLANHQQTQLQLLLPVVVKLIFHPRWQEGEYCVRTVGFSALHEQAGRIAQGGEKPVSNLVRMISM